MSYAEFLFEAGDFRKAARESERVIERFPLSPLKEEAQILKADSFLHAGLYKEAQAELRQFLGNFAGSPLKEETQIKLLNLLRAEENLKGGPAEEIPRKDGVQSYGEGAALSKPTPAEKPVFPPMRAVQVMLFEGKNMEELREELLRLKRSGVDTVILRVFHNRGDRFHRFVKPKGDSGVYFNSSHAPVIADALSPVMDIAHREGLKVFAWMTTRDADYGLEGREELSCKGYDPVGKKFFRCRGLDIFNDEVVRHLEALYQDLASCGIDGILFQDDLILRYNEGFGENAERLFEEETGQRFSAKKLYIEREASPGADYTPAFWEWAAWKNRRLIHVAERLKRAAKKVNPDLKFAINLMYEAVVKPPYALAWLSQDMEKAVEAGFDYYAIMAYQKQMSDELAMDTSGINDMIAVMAQSAARIVGEPNKVLIKLQTMDFSTQRALKNEDVVRLLRRVKGIEGLSIAVVPYRSDFPFDELGGDALLN
ncbi:MAG: hypothetical protein HY883_06455 [Deltaproteobacteria bacterium]|nr:hypothetical protein [Deltaproteobacteria bacterium]